MESAQQVEHIEYRQAERAFECRLVRRQVGAFEDHRVDVGMAADQGPAGLDGLRLHAIAIERQAVLQEGDGVSTGAPTAAKCAWPRFLAEAVMTPILLPLRCLIKSSAEVATGTGDTAERSSW